MSDEDLEDHLFTAARLRNHAAKSLPEDERRELAKMNLQAGFKASRNATFDAAVVLFRKGRELLGKSGWETDGDTMLQLSSREANACFVIGDLETMDRLINEVLSKDLPIEDKFKAYDVKVLAANAAERFDEAMGTIAGRHPPPLKPCPWPKKRRLRSSACPMRYPGESGASGHSHAQLIVIGRGADIPHGPLNDFLRRIDVFFHRYGAPG